MPSISSEDLVREALCFGRWAELNAAGLLDAAGKAAAPSGQSYAPKPVIPDLPT